MMQAAVFEGLESIQLREIAKPELPRNGFLMRVKSCAICGTDVRTFHHGSSFCEPPWVIGHEVAGEVVALGEGTGGVRLGDRVTVAAGIPCGRCTACSQGWTHLCRAVMAHGFHYPGGFAEYMAIAPQALEHNAVNQIPDHISFDQASLTEPLSCVLNGQELVNVKLGDTVVVMGAGPIGCMHVEVARIRGATKVILIEVNPERLKHARAFKADAFIDASVEDPVKRVMALTGQQGADVVIVACPSKKAQTQSIEMAAVRGRISFFGGLPKSDAIVPLDANIIHYREIGVFGAFASSPAQNRIALDLIASGKINVDAIITHRMPLAQVAQGIALMDAGKALKVVVNP